MDRTVLAPDAIPYLPRSWETVGGALAWIAFGSAIPRHDWNKVLYFGAAQGLDPAEAFLHLHCIAVGDDHPACPAGPVPSGWMPELRALADWLRVTQEGSPAGPTRAGEAERSAAAWLLENQDGNRSDRIRDGLEWAAEELRCALAREALAAFGWLGGGRPEGRLTTSRQRIPADVLAAPISLTLDGLLLPFLLGDDEPPCEYGPLFSGILLPEGGILAVWPAPPEDEDPAHGPPLSAPARRRGSASVGRPLHKARDAFAREMVRLALDPDGLPDEGQLRRHMKDWAAQHYEADVPSDTAIGEWIALFDPRKPAPPRRKGEVSRARK